MKSAIKKKIDALRKHYEKVLSEKDEKLLKSLITKHCWIYPSLNLNMTVEEIFHTAQSDIKNYFDETSYRIKAIPFQELVRKG